MTAIFHPFESQEERTHKKRKKWLVTLKWPSPRRLRMTSCGLNSRKMMSVLFAPVIASFLRHRSVTPRSDTEVCAALRYMPAGGCLSSQDDVIVA
jgi:hypothetical protein